MSTRRFEPWVFDHGAQFFTVRDRRFRRYVESWIAEGVVREWTTRIADLRAGRSRALFDGIVRYVPVPAMNAVCKHLASDLDLRTGVRVTALRATPSGWSLETEDGVFGGTWDAVLLAMPPAQAEALLGEAPHLADRTRQAQVSPCVAVMLGFDRPLGLDFEAAFVRDSALTWAARSSAKPGRPDAGTREAWILHAGPDWSARHLAEDDARTTALLREAFRAAAGREVGEPAYAAVHRWRYAMANQPVGEPCLWDASLRLGACGDWCLGGRVESAFLSGAALAGRVLGLPDGSGRE